MLDSWRQQKQNSAGDMRQKDNGPRVDKAENLYMHFNVVHQNSYTMWHFNVVHQNSYTMWHQYSIMEKDPTTNSNMMHSKHAETINAIYLVYKAISNGLNLEHEH